MPGDRCEVVLYTPEHDATSGRSGTGARKVIDLWAERSEALGARPDVDYVLVFENRGAEVGATIAHPHGQIYAFDFVPELPRASSSVRRRSASRAAAWSRSVDDWRAWVPEAPIFPYALRLAPDEPVPDLPSLDRPGRDALAGLLVDVLERLDRLFDGRDAVHAVDPPAAVRRRAWPGAKLHVEIVSPWRAAGVTRYVAAGRARLRRLLQPGRARGRGAVAARRARAAGGLVAQWRWRNCSTSAAAELELPELSSLNRLPAHATLDRAGSPDSPARRRVGVSPGARPEDGARGPAHEAGLEPRRGAGTLDDAGLRQAAVHERPDAVRRPAPERAGAERDRHLPPPLQRCRAAGSAGPVVLHFGGFERRALRARERTARRIWRRTRRRRPSSTSPSSCVTTHRTRCTRSSFGGRMRASSRIRTSGGTRASPARSPSARRPFATSTSGRRSTRISPTASSPSKPEWTAR